MEEQLIVDGHLDIGMNALGKNRDQLKTVEEIRQRERELLITPGQTTEKGRGVNTVSLPAMQRGNVFIGFGTVAARIAHATNDHLGKDGQEICYASAQGELAYYELLESMGEIRLLRCWNDIEDHRSEWEEYLKEKQETTDAAVPPIGLVLAMEGADSIVTPLQVDEWWSHGLRMVGLSHYGQSSYANGTGCEGGLTDAGPDLLAAMDDAGLILDMTHLAQEAFWEAESLFDGPVLASHCNCRALVPGGRQLDDEQLAAIVDRDGVVGVAMDTWMLQEGWEKGVYNEVTATLETVVDHIDHICELAGDTEHVAIGSDLDGGYGLEQVPRDLDTIVDLQKLPDILRDRGYDQADIANITHENWLRLLERAWR